MSSWLVCNSAGSAKRRRVKLKKAGLHTSAMRVVRKLADDEGEKTKRKSKEGGRLVDWRGSKEREKRRLKVVNFWSSGEREEKVRKRREERAESSSSSSSQWAVWAESRAAFLEFQNCTEYELISFTLFASCSSFPTFFSLQKHSCLGCWS